MAIALATNSEVRSMGASRTASKPPCSSSATHRRLTPSMAANSRVTTRTPEARSPCTVGRSRAKWKTTNVVTANRLMPGTASSVRSSMRSSFLSSAPRTLTGRSPAREDEAFALSRRRSPWSRSVQRPDLLDAYLARRREQLRAPAAQPERDVGLREAARRVVAGDDPRAPGQQRRDEVARGRVEVGARLVEQQQLGVVQDRPGDGQPLPGPPAQRAHRVVGAALDVQSRRQLLDALGAHAEQPGLEAQVLAPGQLAVEQ